MLRPSRRLENNNKASGCSSSVERSVRDRKVAGSIPVTPTDYKN